MQDPIFKGNKVPNPETGYPGESSLLGRVLSSFLYMGLTCPHTWRVPLVVWSFHQAGILIVLEQLVSNHWSSTRLCDESCVCRRHL